jgi:hypothetical protein
MANKALVSLFLVVAAVFTAGSVFAHHSFGSMFDGERTVQVKGVVARFEWVNPHTFIIVDVKGSDGKTEQWALEGPAPNGLMRRGYRMDSIKPGESIEACGYGLRNAEPKVDPNSGVNRRLMNVELLTLTDGGTRVWQDYGQRKCRDASGGLFEK